MGEIDGLVFYSIGRLDVMVGLKVRVGELMICLFIKDYVGWYRYARLYWLVEHCIRGHSIKEILGEYWRTL